MRIIQEEIFGSVIAVTTFKDEVEALMIANDTAMAWVLEYGRAIVIKRTGWGVVLRQVEYGLTVIIYTQPTLHLVATRNRGSGVRHTR